MKKLIFRRKALLKLFSLFAGVFIWMYVVSSAEVEINFVSTAHIEVPKGLAIKNELNREIIYRYRGPGLFVRKFLEKQIDINIKSKMYYKRKRYKYNINLDQFKVKLPLGVELLSVEPRSLQFELEKSLEKFVSVKPVFSQKIMDDFNIKGLKVFPEKVKIVGPKSIIRNIKTIETKLIEDLKVGKGMNFYVDISSQDSRVNVLENSVNVSYTLQSKNIEFTYTKVPIIFQSVNLIKSVSPKTVEVKVFGEEGKIQGLIKDSIQVIALIPKGSKGLKDIELIADLPEGVKLVEIKPKKVSVELE